MKLISITDYVLKKELELANSELKGLWLSRFFINVTSYARFLKQPLKLEMFVPCDKDGVPYPDLDNIKDAKNDSMRSAIEWKNFIEIDYPKAKEKVLFKDMKYDDYYEQVYEDGGRIAIDLLLDDVEIIEDLIPFDLELTSNTVKQLGL